MPKPPPFNILTRGQILDLALRKAGNTNAGVRADAIQWLEQILYDLYTLYTWPFTTAFEDVFFTGNGDTFLLPVRFVRSLHDHAFVLTSPDGARTFPREVDHETFITNQQTGTGLPIIWTVGDFIGTVNPLPNLPYTATLYYKQAPVALTDDGDSPDFPWCTYLVDALYVRALEYESDPRAGIEAQKLELTLRRIRNAAYPLNSQRVDVPLDGAIFGRPFDGDF